MDPFDLLARGYFPKELPPPFNTLDFANRVVGHIGSVPAHFLRSKRARLCNHNLVRLGGHRRILAIVNPVVQFNLCSALATNFPRIERLIDRSKLSASTPTPSNDRALVAGRGQLLEKRAALRAGARFLVIADVARFYHSIYTHSISWAVHGKAVSKKVRRNRRKPMLGDRLDHLLMDCQDGQTTGIPVGPDTSLLLAELVASAIDHSLQNVIRDVRGMRFMDDYEFSCRTRREAEELLNALHAALATFELAINPLKSGVFELPMPLDQTWRSPLRTAPMRGTAREQATDLIDLFDMAFTLARTNNDKNVLAYAIGRLSGVHIRTENAALFQHLMLQCLLAEPGTAPLVLERLALSHGKGLAVNREELAALLNDQIVEHAPLAHSTETSWALWGLLVFDLRLSKPAVKALALTNDSVTALLSLHAEQRGLVQGSLNKQHWLKLISDPEPLYGEHWLLAYEANIKGWLRAGRDYVGADANFKWLRDLGVEFYDTAKASPINVDGSDDVEKWLDLEALLHRDEYGPTWESPESDGDFEDLEYGEEQDDKTEDDDEIAF